MRYGKGLARGENRMAEKEGLVDMAARPGIGEDAYRIQNSFY